MRRLTAILCLTLAVLLGSAGVSESADFQKGKSAYYDGDYATALRELRPFANQGNAYVQYLMGDMYENGLGVPQRYEIALKWYRLSAAQGNETGQHALGMLLDRIAGQKPSPTVTAKKTPAPSSGDFQKGLDAYNKRDFATALREWKPLAEQGNARAQTNLGLMYRLGPGVPKDKKTAVKWYTLAAEQGYARAQYNLGVMYDKGEGVPQDYKIAVKWYRLAAEQGYASAQFNLGVMYSNGKGVPRDNKTAVKWWRLAAEQGDVDAQKEVERLEKRIAEQQPSPTVTAEKAPTPSSDAVQKELERLRSENERLKEQKKPPPHSHCRETKTQGRPTTTSGTRTSHPGSTAGSGSIFRQTRRHHRCENQVCYSTMAETKRFSRYW